MTAVTQRRPRSRRFAQNSTRFWPSLVSAEGERVRFSSGAPCEQSRDGTDRAADITPLKSFGARMSSIVETVACTPVHAATVQRLRRRPTPSSTRYLGWREEPLGAAKAGSRINRLRGISDLGNNGRSASLAARYAPERSRSLLTLGRAQSRPGHHTRLLYRRKTQPDAAPKHSSERYAATGNRLTSEASSSK